jgi:hypothetical protein
MNYIFNLMQACLPNEDHDTNFDEEDELSGDNDIDSEHKEDFEQNNHLQVTVIQILNMNLMINCVERKLTFGVSTKCIKIFYEVDAISLSLSIYIVYLYWFFFFAICLRSKTLTYFIEHFS